MAIQVSGTEVISNSRVLSNVTGLKTVGGTAILGSGDIAVGGSTTFGAVGTYAYLYTPLTTGIVEDSTLAGSNLYPSGTGNTVGADGFDWAYSSRGGTAVSGTWRAMGRWNYTASGSYGRSTVWVRIS